MAASPQILPSKPFYLNALTLTYTATELRRFMGEVPLLGPGAVDYASFRVVQRAAGANMSVDVTAASVLNRYWLRSTISINDSVSATDDAGLYRQDHLNATPVNLDIAAADATNPRIDQVFLCVEDSQASGINNQATIRVVTGTATGGATLDNRTGVGAAPAGMVSELLADVLVPAASVTVITVNIRDRRRFGTQGGMPMLSGVVTAQVNLIPCDALPRRASGTTNPAVLQGNSDSRQAAALMFLPARVPSAARFRWRYLQGGTAIATQYVLFLADASGRIVAQSAATAFTGALNTYIEANVAFTAPVTLERGWYYGGIGISAAMTAGSSAFWEGVNMRIENAGTAGSVHALRNLAYHSATGGTTVPSTILAFTDMQTVGVGILLPPSVPLMGIDI